MRCLQPWVQAPAWSIPTASLQARRVNRRGHAGRLVTHQSGEGFFFAITRQAGGTLSIFKQARPEWRERELGAFLAESSAIGADDR